MRMKFMVVVCGLAVGMVSMAVAEPALKETISSEDLLSGAANERLEGIGRRAAENELVLQVNAPDIWESEILTPVRRGAGDIRIEIKFVNALRDTVVIRGVGADEAEDPLETLKRITNNAKARSLLEDEPREKESESAPRDSAASSGQSPSRPDIERPDTEVPEMRVKRPAAKLPRSDAGESSRRAREDRDEGRLASRPRPEPSEQPDPVPPAATPTPEEEQAPADESEAVEERRRFERLYNDGRTIREDLGADDLKKGDLIFSGAHYNVVVRQGISTKTYWLKGDLPEERIEHQERNRYLVADSVPDSMPDPAQVDAAPGPREERERFEDLYNGGREIESTIGISDLRPGDELYLGDNVTVVLRRSRVNIEAHWLTESVNLDQEGIEHEEKNKYVVVGDLR